MKKNEKARWEREKAKLLKLDDKLRHLVENIENAAEIAPGTQANNLLANARLAQEIRGNVLDMAEGINDLLLETAPVNLPVAVDHEGKAIS